MTINKFNEYLKAIPHIETQLVYLRYKYEWENEWTYSNEILTVDMNVEGYYCWLKDWDEGQQDVEILGCVALSDVSVPCFISHKCGRECCNRVKTTIQQNLNGSWSEAKPIHFYPNFVQRIAQWLKRMVK